MNLKFLLFDKLENYHASTGCIIWSTLFALVAHVVTTIGYFTSIGLVASLFLAGCGRSLFEPCSS
jgi:hypothetical protein